MIKASAISTTTGKPMLILGLSANNLTRLRGGDPLIVTPDDMDGLNLPPIGIWVVAAETEDAILAEFQRAGISIGHLDDRR